MKIEPSTILLRKSFEQGLFLTLSQKPELPLCELKQVHGAEVLPPSKIPEREADGLLDEDQESILAIRTADCLPILLLSSESYALIHAGWRGLAAGILSHPSLLKQSFTHVFVAPCIHAESFEVSEDFFHNFPGTLKKISKNGCFYFDLVAEAKEQITQNWERVIWEDSGVCTFANPSFHSFRRDKTDQRNWNIFIPSRILGQVQGI